MRKRRILSLLTALALCLSLLPVTALADENVAAIDGKEYDTLANAINNVPGDGTATTITLLKNFSTNSFEIPSDKNITLDLNGCELDLGSGQYGITVKGDSILTLQDGSSAKTGRLSFCVNDKKGAVVYTDVGSARFNLRSGAIKATTSLTGDSFYGVRFLGTLDLTGGSVTATASGYVEPIAVGMTNGGNGGTINCDLSAINTSKTKGIALEVARNVSSVVINGGTFTGSQYSIESKSGLKVNGGTFNNISASGSNCSGSSFSSCTINGTLTLGSNECTFEHVTFGTDAQLSSTLYKLADGQVVSTNAPKITFATNAADMGLIKIDSYEFSNPFSSGGYNNPMESRTWSVNSGSTATVTATAVPADKNHEFVGWYDTNSTSGTKHSDETTVTYTAAPEKGVTENVSYYAVFKETKAYAAMKTAAQNWANGESPTISSVTDMGYFAYAVNELGMNFSGKTVKLGADLTYTDANSFTPIGTAAHPFNGTFDGNEKTISGLSAEGTYYTNDTGSYLGLFGCTSGAEIKNLTLSGVDFNGAYMAGGFAGEANSTTFTNCTLTGGSEVSHAYYTGGLFGHSSGGCTVTGCTVENSVLDGPWKTGGITGYADGVTISGTTVNNTEVKGIGVGALIGHANAGNTALTNVTVADVTDGEQKKINVIGTTYNGENSHSITVSGDSTNIDAAGLVPSDSKSNVQVSGGDFTFVIPDRYVPDSTDKISVTFKNGEEIVIVHVISSGGKVTLPAEPTKDNYNFEGWYVDGKKITGETTFDVNTVVNAQWSDIPVASVTLNQYNLSLFVGGTATLTATVEPENATNKTVTWSSSDATVATVDNGTVTAKSEGTAVITVSSEENTEVKATCTVTVTKKEYGITAAPNVLDFGSVYSAYWQPDARTVTITNTGNQTVTLNSLAASSYFEIGELSKVELALDDTATFTVRPRADLPIGNYSETIRVTGSNEVSADIIVSFAVVERPVSSGGVTPPTHDISVDSGSHGDVEIWPEEAKQGTTVTITATPDKGYEVADVTVTAENGKEITVTDKGNNKYTFMMPGSDVTIEVTFQPVSGGGTSGDLTITAPAGWVNPYTDVAANAWYYDAVGYATANGLMGGVGSNAFDPSGSMNRAMVWTVIARLAGQSISGSTWAEDARTWAMAQGVSDGTNPDGAVSREELVTMLYRYAGSPAMNVPELALIGNYPDSADVSAWAQNAFAWAISKGIIEGRDGKLAAGEVLTRAEAATILARFHLLTQ